MKINDLITPSEVKVMASGTSKKRLFHELGDLAQARYDLNPQRTVEALMERETLGPTGVGDGVALPHARMSDVTRVCGLFVRMEKPIDFDAVDRMPVDLVFALFAPVDAGVEHLRALAVVSRTLRDGGTRAKLRANADPATLFLVLTANSANQAA